MEDQEVETSAKNVIYLYIFRDANSSCEETLCRRFGELHLTRKRITTYYYELLYKRAGQFKKKKSNNSAGSNVVKVHPLWCWTGASSSTIKTWPKVQGLITLSLYDAIASRKNKFLFFLLLETFCTRNMSFRDQTCVSLVVHWNDGWCNVVYDVFDHLNFSKFE